MGKQVYDFVIVGSGLGGLQCAYILADEGYSVCVLEKNHQIGGNLQVFSRDKVIFDTGVHYIGGLDKGQNLHQIFKYFNLMDKLHLLKMDEDRFDVISFYDDPNEYWFAQGYEKFAATLKRQFADEHAAIDAYCAKMKEVCLRFPMYNLNFEESNYLEDDSLTVGAKEYIDSLTSNEKLAAVLAGNNVLYAGEADKTPLYVHALVINTYIESSYRCVDGGSQIAKYLSKQVHEMGGVVLKRKDVVSFEMVEGNIDAAVTSEGEKYYGKNFISNAHPSSTLKLLPSGSIRKSYFNRISKLENTVSTFVTHVVCKPNSFKYRNHNYYVHKDMDSVWGAVETKDFDLWPEGYMLSTPAHKNQGEYAKGVILLTYMSIDEMKPWLETFNTVAKNGDRGEAYEAFKKMKEEKLLKIAAKKFPELNDCIQSVHSSTPLTFRDYIGNLDGSLYGVVKDKNSPLRSFITPKTKVPNLYFTGQNINLHGILGVSISALVTCSEFMDKKYLIDKINNA